MAILQDQRQDLAAKIAALEAENKALRDKAAARNNRALSWKVSEKGAVSVYGLGRFPVTLYHSQFVKLDAVWDDLRAFVKTAHDNGELSTKD